MGGKTEAKFEAGCERPFGPIKGQAPLSRWLPFVPTVVHTRMGTLSPPPQVTSFFTGILLSFQPPNPKNTKTLYLEVGVTWILPHFLPTSQNDTIVSLSYFTHHSTSGSLDSPTKLMYKSTKTGHVGNLVQTHQREHRGRQKAIPNWERRGPLCQNPLAKGPSARPGPRRPPVLGIAAVLAKFTVATWQRGRSSPSPFRARRAWEGRTWRPASAPC